jgi:uncharacterized damage-inducible protein DinB
MSLTKQIAKQFRELYWGGNWTGVSLKENLADVDWQQATTNVYSLNTIAALIHHMNFYVDALITVLRGEALTASDKYSFEHPAILSSNDWNKLLDKTWNEAEQFATMVEQMPEGRLWETFSDGKYGNYYRNIQGVIEHAHYHLGQIALIKKIIQSK